MGRLLGGGASCRSIVLARHFFAAAGRAMIAGLRLPTRDRRRASWGTSGAWDSAGWSFARQLGTFAARSSRRLHTRRQECGRPRSAPQRISRALVLVRVWTPPRRALKCRGSSCLQVCSSPPECAPERSCGRRGCWRCLRPKGVHHATPDLQCNDGGAARVFRSGGVPPIKSGIAVLTGAQYGQRSQFP
jgi:hypothetical protein